MFRNQKMTVVLKLNKIYFKLEGKIDWIISFILLRTCSVFTLKRIFVILIHAGYCGWSMNLLVWMSLEEKSTICLGKLGVKYSVCMAKIWNSTSNNCGASYFFNTTVNMNKKIFMIELMMFKMCKKNNINSSNNI